MMLSGGGAFFWGVGMAFFLSFFFIYISSFYFEIFFFSKMAFFM